MSPATEAAVRAAERFGLDPGGLRALGGNSGSAWAIAGRVIRVGPAAIIDAEVAAASAAAAAVPVPAVLDRVDADRESAVLLDRLPGEPAGDLAQRRPDLAREIGRACGRLHARLAAVPAPSGLRTVPAPAGDAPQDVARPGVVHLDLHPFNVLLVAGEAVSGVLDWANAAAGDPDLDRARTWSILALDPAARARARDPAWADMAAGWREAGGLDDLPAPARLWACGFMLSDLAGRYPPGDLRHVAGALRAAQNTT